MCQYKDRLFMYRDFNQKLIFFIMGSLYWKIEFFILRRHTVASNVSPNAIVIIAKIPEREINCISMLYTRPQMKMQNYFALGV